MATSMITIQNGKIIADFCSVVKRPLFNGIILHLYSKLNDFIGCLLNYPYAFGNGSKCCSAENNNIHSTCNESPLSYSSACCRGKSIKCPKKSDKCLNFGKNFLFGLYYSFYY